MDLDDFRSILDTTNVDVWTFIDTAILVASLDYGVELKYRRDKIVERLYATCISNQCRNCDFGGRNMVEDEIVDVGVKEEKNDIRGEKSPCTPRSVNGEDDVDPYGVLFDDDQKRILEIREQLEDPRQSEDSLVGLLQSLADMDITFQALQETDIGRHVNRLRKHSSNDIKRLVKHLVRKWKDIVDEWVRLNPPGEHRSPELMVDGDSPPQKNPQNVRHKVPDFAYSPNPQNGSSGSEKNNSEPERKPNPKPKPVPPRREPPARPSPSAPTPPSIQRQREQRDNVIDAERLASASKRLQENYKEAENAKRQRTIQVMDIHELPKPKSRNAFFPKNKGGSSQGRHR